MKILIVALNMLKTKILEGMRKAHFGFKKAYDGYQN